MTNVWCVRANDGCYAKQFVEGGYIALGFEEANVDLSAMKNRTELKVLYRDKNPEQTNERSIRAQVGQMVRFLFKIKAGDFVITPAYNTNIFYFGRVGPDSHYYFSMEDDECPYPHRRSVNWSEETLSRRDFSVKFQNTMRSMLAVFSVYQVEEFLTVIKKKMEKASLSVKDDRRQRVLRGVVELDEKEFEVLMVHLLTVLGFERSSIRNNGKGEGVAVFGELQISPLAKVELLVQARCLEVGTKIDAEAIKHFRSSIPFGAQGTFITTAGFETKASEVAVEKGFPRIELVSGPQLADLLVEHWNDIPTEFQDRLGLKPGLVIG